MKKVNTNLHNYNYDKSYVRKNSFFFKLLKAYYTIWLSRPSVCFVEFGLKFSYIYFQGVCYFSHLF